MRHAAATLALLLSAGAAVARDGVTRLTETNFQDFISTGNVIVAVHGQHDEPSREYVRTFRAFCAAQQQVRCGALNLDEDYFSGIRRYEVLPLPTTLLFKDGKWLGPENGILRDSVAAEDLGQKVEETYGTH